MYSLSTPFSPFFSLLFSYHSLVDLLNGCENSDLKPNNVLYRSGSVVVCDWGSATQEGERGVLPTLGYRPPELLLSRVDSEAGSWSCAIDIWSWGFEKEEEVMNSVLVIELLSEEYLWNSESELTVTNQVIKLAGTADLSVVLMEELKCRRQIKRCSIPGVLVFIWLFLHFLPHSKLY